MKSLSVLVVATAVAIFSIGCSPQPILTGGAQPGVNVANFKTIYVVTENGDATKAVVKDLNRRGVKTTVGDEPKLAPDADCMAFVDTVWVWDMSPYLHDLRIQFVNLKTRMPMAEGHSQRYTFGRASTEEMVKEVLDKIYGVSTPAK